MTSVSKDTHCTDPSTPVRLARKVPLALAGQVGVASAEVLIPDGRWTLFGLRDGFWGVESTIHV